MYRSAVMPVDPRYSARQSFRAMSGEKNAGPVHYPCPDTARQTMRVVAVVVIGPPGSGKTSVLTALHDMLADRDAAHAVVEVEAVAWAHPPLGDGQSLRHLESLCHMYPVSY